MMKKTNIFKSVALVFLGTACLASAQTRIDVLLCYTPNIKNNNGGQSQTRALYDTQWFRARDTQANSNTNVNLQRAGWFEPSYNSSNTSSYQLAALYGSKGGTLQGVRDERDNVDADLVQLCCQFTNWQTVAGSAYLRNWPSVIKGGILNVTSGYRRYTCSHEFGHNLNATHAHGHNMNASYATVMKPANEIGSRTRINYFSDDVDTYFGGVRLGNSTHNNSQRVVNQKVTTSNYK